MTRRRVLYALLPLTPLLALWAAHTLDHLTGWYDPVERRLAWHDG